MAHMWQILYLGNRSPLKIDDGLVVDDFAALIPELVRVP